MGAGAAHAQLVVFMSRFTYNLFIRLALEIVHQFGRDDL